MLFFEELVDFIASEFGLLLGKQYEQFLKLSFIYFLNLVTDAHFSFDILCGIDPIEAVLFPAFFIAVLSKDLTELL